MASFDGRHTKTSDISIPDILNGDTNDDEMSEEEVILRPKESNSNEDHVFADVIDETNPAPAPRKRRSGVVNSMERLNKISTSEFPENLDIDDTTKYSGQTINNDKRNPSSSEYISSSSSSSSESSNKPYEHENHEEYQEMHDKVFNLAPISDSVIYDETRPKRCNYLKNQKNSSNVVYDETKPKRKVSFDTAMPKIRKLRTDDMPIRKISLDAGLDSRNIRKINFEPNSGLKLKQCTTPETKNDNIRQIMFDEESGTLHIRQVNLEERNCDEPIQFDAQSDTPCTTPRKMSMSYEADSEPDISHINRGFENDTYLDNVTFKVERVYPDLQENDLNGYPKRYNGTCTNADTYSGEARGILKSSKNRGSQDSVPTGDADENSALASHLRKDSIALTSEKLGQILDLQKHYAQVHKREKPFSKQREIIKKYQLHLGVASLFVLTLILVSIGWHFHDRAKKEKTISQRIFFEASSRHITLTNPSEKDTISGRLGLQLSKWQLPTHCPREEETQEFQCLRWKNNAILRISYFTPPSLRCYNVSWESLNPNIYPLDCYSIGQSSWFGPSNATYPPWPLSDVSFTFSASFSQNFDAGTFNSAVENYWLSSGGTGVLIKDNIPLVMYWNNMQKGSWCISSNYTGDFYGYKAHHGKKQFLNYTLCNGNDPLATHTYFREHQIVPGPSELPSKSLYTHPLWPTKGDRDTSSVSESDVMDMAERVSSNNLTCGSIVIDGKWEGIQGDFVFDEQRFPNISTMEESVSSIAKCSLTASFNPYFHYMSQSFSDGHPKDHFILDASGKVPALVQWNDEVMAMLDVTHPSARSWITGKMLSLTSMYNIKSFKMTYGKPTWLPFHPRFHDKNVTPNEVKKQFSEMLVSFHARNADIIEGTSQTQNLPYFVSVPTKVENTENGLCLANAIQTSLALGLMGYPYVMADGIIYENDNLEEKTLLPRDLYIRWIQMATFFPGMKYSTPPWIYDNDCIEVARNASIIHKETVSTEMESLTDELRSGKPILRPIWWVDPDDPVAHKVGDSFLVGNTYLVAPILCEGQTTRKIYFPDGIWKDLRTGKLFLGKRWVNFPVSLHHFPFFKRSEVYGIVEK